MSECSVFILIREKMGTRILIETARDELSPKVRQCNHHGGGFDSVLQIYHESTDDLMLD